MCVYKLSLTIGFALLCPVICFALGLTDVCVDTLTLLTTSLFASKVIIIVLLSISVALIAHSLLKLNQYQISYHQQQLR